MAATVETRRCFAGAVIAEEVQEDDMRDRDVEDLEDREAHEVDDGGVERQPCAHCVLGPAA